MAVGEGTLRKERFKGGDGSGGGLHDVFCQQLSGSPRVCQCESDFGKKQLQLDDAVTACFSGLKPFDKQAAI